MKDSISLDVKRILCHRAAPIFFILILILILFSPLLFFGKIVLSEEDIGAYYPMMFFYQQAIRNGESFLWNNFYYGGFPTFLNILGGFFHPLHYFLFKFLPLFPAYHLAIAIPVFFGALFSYLFGRANSFSKTGSLILALAYTLSHTMDGLTTTLSYANGFMTVPALFYFILKIKQADNLKNRILWFLFGAAISAVGFLAGFSQLVLYGLTFALLYALFLDWYYSRQTPKSFWRRHSGVISLILAVILGALLAAPQILPTLEFVDISIRTLGYAQEISKYPSAGYFLTFLFPDSVRIPFLVNTIPGLYIGVLPLLFAVAGAVFFRTAITRFFTFSYLLIFALAVNFPVISLINQLPIFSRISHTGRWFLIGAFALSFLAAHGFEELRQRPLEWFAQNKSFRRFLKISGWVIVLIIFGSVAANVILYFLSLNPELKTKLLDILLRYRSLSSSLPLEHYLNVFDRAIADALSSISVLNWRFFLPLILFPVSFYVLKFRTKSVASYWFAPVSLVLVTINIFVAFAASYGGFVSSNLFKDPPAIVKAIIGLEKDLSSFRFLPFLTGEALFREILSKRKLSASEEASIHKEFLTNQIGAFYGIQNIQGFEPLRSLRQSQLLDGVLAPHARTIFDKGEIGEVSLEEKISDFMKCLPLLSVLNVKYIVSVYPLKDRRLKEVPLKSSPDFPLPLHLYENKEVMPRVYFAKRPLYWQGDDKELLLAVAEKTDFRRETFIECRGCKYPVSDPGKSTIEILRYVNGALNLSVNSEKGGWLIFSESNLPGWVASLDEEHVPIFSANYLFQSVFVPKGEHRLEFNYRGSFKLFLERFVPS